MVWFKKAQWEFSDSTNGGKNKRVVLATWNGNAAVEEISLFRQKIADIESDLSLEYDVTISVAVKPAEQVRRYAAVLPYYANVMREGIRIHETTRGGSS